ncbi:Ribose ABC transport system, permease protein RbsC (TC 3.A.1.2.1) [Klebsiella pneumoniae IS46]|nr:Ribose ABC transport system, permease protein RbsC (TC 3.A.1.2.1) [Klebsiella pneumoniae IS46]
MTTQAVSGRRYFTKAWLMEQKSLIALLVLIAVVSTMSPNFFLPSITCSIFCSKPPLTPLWR